MTKRWRPGRRGRRPERQRGPLLRLPRRPPNSKPQSSPSPTRGHSHFISAPLNDRDAESIERTAQIVADHPEAGKAEVVAGFLSSYAKAAAKITDKLQASGIPGSAYPRMAMPTK